MIWIDDRIGSKELLPEMRKGVPASLTHLKFGDAMFLGSGPDNSLIPIGIERKAITDLVSSIMSGRLTSHQLVGLLHTYQYVYLLVEGVFRTNPRNGLLEQYRNKKVKWMPISFGRQKFMGRAVNNYLNRLAVFYNIKVVITDNITQSGLWLSDVYSWWNKPWEKHDAHAGFYTAPFQPKIVKEGDPIPVAQLFSPPFIQRVIKEFSGVGWKRSEGMMEYFKTLDALVTASKKDFMKVPGVGKHLAESIYKEVHGV